MYMAKFKNSNGAAMFLPIIVAISRAHSTTATLQNSSTQKKLLKLLLFYDHTEKQEKENKHNI